MPQTNVPLAKKLARNLGVKVEPSKDPCKKLDVFHLKTGKKLATIGSKKHEDYLQHLDKKRRTSYKARMERHRNNPNTPSYFADRILWPSDQQMNKL